VQLAIRNPPPSVPARDDSQGFRARAFRSRAVVRTSTWDRIMSELAGRARAEQVAARRGNRGAYTSNDYAVPMDIEMIDL